MGARVVLLFLQKDNTPFAIFRRLPGAGCRVPGRQCPTWAGWPGSPARVQAKADQAIPVVALCAYLPP